MLAAFILLSKVTNSGTSATVPRCWVEGRAPAPAAAKQQLQASIPADMNLRARCTPGAVVPPRKTNFVMAKLLMHMQRARARGGLMVAFKGTVRARLVQSRSKASFDSYRSVARLDIDTGGGRPAGRPPPRALMWI